MCEGGAHTTGDCMSKGHWSMQDELRLADKRGKYGKKGRCGALRKNGDGARDDGRDKSYSICWSRGCCRPLSEQRRLK